MTIAGLLAGWLVVASREAALPHPPVHLQVGVCRGIREAELRRIVAVELRAALAVEAEGAVTRVQAECRDRGVDLTVRDATTGESLRRTVDLDSAPSKGRERVLALALVELVERSWSEQSPPPPVNAEQARPAASSARSPPQRPWRWTAIAHGRVFPSRRGFGAVGLGVGVGRRSGDHVVGTVDLLYDHGNVAVPLGTISIDSLSAGIGARFVAGYETVSFFGGPGLRVGLARISGSGANSRARGDVLVSPWGGPTATLGVQIEPIRHLLVDIAAEGGVELASANALADGARAVSLSGGWMSASLGLGSRF